MTQPEGTPNDMDLRSRVVANEQKITVHEARLVNIENWKNQRDISDARKDEQFKNMDKRFDTLDANIVAINDTMRWINRIIITAIIVAFVAFAIGGGLKLPTVTTPAVFDASVATLK